MKTLNEVIKAYEICMSDGDECNDCPYTDEMGEPKCWGVDKADALHYLREYRDKRDRIFNLEKRMEKYAKIISAIEVFTNENAG